MSFLKKTASTSIIDTLVDAQSTLAGEITDATNSIGLFTSALKDAHSTKQTAEIQAAAVRDARDILDAAGVTL